MKNLKTISLIAAFIISCSFALAQEEGTGSISRHAKFISNKGFWVIESNVKTPKSSTVHFYGNDKKLLYSASIAGKKLNPERRRTLKNLNKVLEQVVNTREIAVAAQQQQEWIAILSGKR